MIAQATHPTFYATTTRWLEKPSGVQKLVFQPLIKGLDWTEIGKGALTPTLAKSRGFLKKAHSLTNWLELSKKIRKLKSSVSALSLQDPLLKSTEKTIFAFKNTMSLIKMGAVGLEMLYEEGIIFLSAHSLEIIKSIGFLTCLATFLKSLIEIKETIYQLFDSQQGDPARNLQWLRLACKVCSLIGALFAMMIFTLGGEMLAKWVILGVSTLSLSLSISKHYYKYLYVN